MVALKRLCLLGAGFFVALHSGDTASYFAQGAEDSCCHHS